MATTLVVQQGGWAALLAAYFQAGGSPTNLYIGLSKEATVSGYAVTLAQLTELSGNGYGRVPLVANGTNFAIASITAGKSVTSGNFVFTNNSGHAWDGAINAFLIDSGTAGQGTVIAYGALATTRALQGGGDTETVSFVINFTSSGG